MAKEALSKKVLGTGGIVQTFVRQLRQNNLEVKLVEKEKGNIMDRLGYKLETMIGVDLASKQVSCRRKKTIL